jgi:CheY-like chemotaxis protein
LVVEDEPTARRELAEMLETKDRKVSRARSGKEAVTKVNKGKADIDAVLVDIKMSGAFDGIEAAHQIQHYHRDIPIIFVTAFEGNRVYHQRVEKLELKVVSWISKPIIGASKEKLMNTLEQEEKKKEIRVEVEDTLSKNARPANLQILLEKLVSLHGIDLIAEVIQDIKWIHSSNGLNTDDLFPYFNFIVYQNMQSELEKKYSGQFVAFLACFRHIYTKYNI